VQAEFDCCGIGQVERRPGFAVGVLNGRANKDLELASKRCAIPGGESLDAPAVGPIHTLWLL
jgi:hypothetical protein